MQWECSFFPFWTGNTSLGKFGPKNQNSHFELKFGTMNNLNMRNSMAMLIFFVLDWKYSFLGQIWSKKSKLVILSLNLVIRLT